VWLRQGLTLKFQRPLWLEQKTAAEGGVLTESHLKLLRRHRGRVSDPGQHVEAPTPGFLLCQDTYFVGTIKGVGKIYLQSVIDANCSLGFGKLYLSKVPMTAVDVLNDRVLPFYEEHGVAIEHILTDNGRETCGKPLSHPYELYLTIQQIEHRRCSDPQFDETPSAGTISVPRGVRWRTCHGVRTDGGCSRPSSSVSRLAA
jgi:hypothetical protein